MRISDWSSDVCSSDLSSSSCRTRTRCWPARPSTGPSRSCRSRPASSPVRRRSDGYQVSPFRDLDDAGLVQALSDAKEELFNLRFPNATGQLDNVDRLGQVRKDGEIGRAHACTPVTNGHLV